MRTLLYLLTDNMNENIKEATITSETPDFFEDLDWRVTRRVTEGSRKIARNKTLTINHPET